MTNVNEKTVKREWVTPTLAKMSTDDAEANGTGVNDGGSVGNSRS